ncbi:glycosyl hydrolase family 18 protein [Pseudescherichia vulneris]
MRLNKLTTAILFSAVGFPMLSSAANVTANDQTNSFSGLDYSMMITKDGGHTWTAYTDASQNNFPGTVLAEIAPKQELAIISEDYDPNRTYRGGETVRFLGYYWTAQWWVDQGISPGTDPVWKSGDAINIKPYATFQFTPYTGQDAIDLQTREKARVAAQRKVIGYFPEWGVYEAHNFFTPDKVDYAGLSHLNYGFAVVKDGIVTMHDTEKAPGLIKDLEARTDKANVAHMISVGGWNNSQEGVFEAATATDAGLERLANSMVSYMAKWHFDGLDIDWEYPDTEAEKAQFTKLIQSLRTKLDAQGKKDDKYYQLSAAVTTNHNNIQFINPAVTAPLLDSVNVMAYDIHGAFDPLTGHNAPLFENSHDEDKDLNVADTMTAYVETWKVPKAKLMMGIPYYGRGWGHVPGTELIPGLPGMFNTGAATVKGAWDDAQDMTGTNPWYVLKDKLNSGEYTRYWDSESHVPYLYSKTKQEFLTYDDPQSIQEKVDYINAQGFGGAILWDISGDTPEHELGHIVDDILTTPMPQPNPDPQPDPDPQPQPDPTPATGVKATLFQNTGFAGDSLQVTEDIDCLGGIKMNGGKNANDEASSVSLEDGSLGINLFKECHFAGDKVTYLADATSLSSGFNDMVSSVQMIKAIGYKDTGYASSSLNIVGDMEWLGDDLSFNDVMSSIKVAEGYTVRLYSDRNFAGSSVDVKAGQNITDLNSLSFNNKVSSLKIITNVEPEPQPEPEPTPTIDAKATLFQNTAFAGDSLQVTEDIDCLNGMEMIGGKNANDEASSVSLGEGSLGINLYKECHFAGDMVSYTADATSLSSGFNDRVSSVQMIKAIGYKDNGYRSSFLNIVGDMEWLGDDLHFNDVMSSIKVAEGYTVRLYADRDFAGSYVDVTAGQNITDLNSVKFDNKVSSLKVFANDEPEPQPAPEPQPTPVSGLKATLFQSSGATGDSLDITGDIDCLNGVKMKNGFEADNEVSAVMVPESSLGIRLYKDCQFKGGSYIYKYHKNHAPYDMTRTGIDMNKAASSVLVVKASAYDATYYKGNSLDIMGDTPWLNGGYQYWEYMPNFDGKMTSIKVAEGYTARVYADRDYQGDYIDVKAGEQIPDLKKLSFDNKASSIKFFIDKAK